PCRSAWTRPRRPRTPPTSRQSAPRAHARARTPATRRAPSRRAQPARLPPAPPTTRTAAPSRPAASAAPGWAWPSTVPCEPALTAGRELVDRVLLLLGRLQLAQPGHHLGQRARAHRLRRRRRAGVIQLAGERQRRRRERRLGQRRTEPLQIPADSCHNP